MNSSVLSASRKNILVVDDEAAFLESLSEGLRLYDEEFEVFTAENGRKALEEFRRGRRIDLLVTDLRMPEMDGFELLSNIRRDFPGTRAILMTAFVTEEIEKRLKAIGNYACIEKPVGFDELRRRIRGELDFSPILEDGSAPGIGEEIFDFKSKLFN